MKKLILIVALIGLMLVAGCDMSEEDIRSRMIESNSGLDSYSFDMIMDMETSTVVDGQPVNMLTKMDSEGKVDDVNKKLSIIGTMEMDMDQMRQEMDMDIYLVDSYMYTKIGNQWIKTAFSEDIWNEQDQIQNTLELVKSGTTEILEEEMIEGEEHYVLKINPDLKMVIQQVLESQNQADIFNLDMDFEDIIKSYSLTVWVNKETFFMKKMRTEMDMVMTQENIGITDAEEDIGEFMIRSTSDIVITGVNEDFVITLPAEAESAVSMADLLNV